TDRPWRQRQVSMSVLPFYNIKQAITPVEQREHTHMGMEHHPTPQVATRPEAASQLLGAAQRVRWLGNRFWKWYRAGLAQAALTGVVVAFVVAGLSRGNGGTTGAAAQQGVTPATTAHRTAVSEPGQTVLHVRGTGTRNTAIFSVTGAWELRYS